MFIGTMKFVVLYHCLVINRALLFQNVEAQTSNSLLSFLSIFFLQSERSELIEQIKALRSDNYEISKIVGEKFKEIAPLRQDLKKVRSAHANHNGGLCSSEVELDARVSFITELCYLQIHLLIVLL